MDVLVLTIFSLVFLIIIISLAIVILSRTGNSNKKSENQESTKTNLKSKKEEIIKILKKEVLPRWKRWTLAFVVISLSAKGFGLSVGYALGLAVIGTLSYIILYHMNKWIYERDWIWFWVQVSLWGLVAFLLYSYIKNRWYS